MATFYRPANSIMVDQMQKRMMWTFFHLPSTQPWPAWLDAAEPGDKQYSDSYLGPLSDTPGLENVRLGRRVEVVEQAAFITLWNSADALIAFQTSPLFSTFLNALGVTASSSGEATSTALARTSSLQWELGFNMDTDLHGRITLNKYKGIGTWESWHLGKGRALDGFFPLGCKDVDRKRPPMNRWCFTWVDHQGGELQGGWHWDTGNGDEQQGEIRGDERTRERWELLRWNNPSYGATRELEEESTKQPGARQHWEAAAKRYMPPVQTWEQERWDIDTPHQSPNYPLERFDEAFDEDEEGSDLSFEIEQDESLPKFVL